jgi:UMF1 family MFS transporter
MNKQGEHPRTVKAVNVASWSLYDLANQFYVLNILSLYYPRWIVLKHNIPEIIFSFAFGLSVFLVAVLAPVLGYFADRKKQAKLYLGLFTYLAIGATSFIGAVDSVALSLVLFIVSNFGCQMAVVFYNALLASIANKSDIGFISGLGRMCGYLGAGLALLYVNPFLLKLGYPFVFYGTSIAFFLFSLPCLLLIRPHPPVFKDKPEEPMPSENLSQFIAQMKVSFKSLYALPVLRLFVHAAFWSLIVVNVVIIYMPVYASEVFLLDEAQLRLFMLIGAISAVTGSVFFGYLCDRKGPVFSLQIIFYLWIACLIYAGLVQTPSLIFLVSILAGVSLGSVFVVARVLIIQIVPSQKINAAFGLFNIVAYSASIVGPILWGLFVLIFSVLGVWRYRAALLLLNIFLFRGLALLLKLKQSGAGE